MRFLLDTHVVAWLAEGRPAEPALIADLTDPENARWVSAVSAMEMSTKVHAGRWEPARTIVDRWDATLVGLQAERLAVAHNHGLLAGTLAWPHRDPFDRLLVAQAQLEGLTLVTADRVMLDAPGVDIRPWR